MTMVFEDLYIKVLLLDYTLKIKIVMAISYLNKKWDALSSFAYLFPLLQHNLWNTSHFVVLFALQNPQIGNIQYKTFYKCVTFSLEIKLNLT